MSDGFDLVVADDATPALAQVGDAVQRNLANASDVLAASLLTTARALASGGMVEARSGHYLESLHVETTSHDDGVDVTLSSNSPLAHLIEHGVRVPAHDILPSASEVLRFDGGVGEVFAKVVHVPQTTIPARPVLHTALDMMSGRIVDGLGDAAQRAIEEATR